jgi:hypothetical protein
LDEKVSKIMKVNPAYSLLKEWFEEMNSKTGENDKK